MSYLVSPQYGAPQAQKRPSIHETVVPGGLSEQMNQHFVHHFSGSALDSIWSTKDLAGTGTFAMDDAENGGFKITCGATTNDASIIHFNDINHYDDAGCKFITEVKSASTSANQTKVGVSGNENSNQYMLMRKHNAQWGLNTGGASSTNTVTASTAADTNLNRFAAEKRVSSAILWINGILEAVATTDLPTVKMEPMFLQNTLENVAKTAHITKMEVFNT